MHTRRTTGAVMLVAMLAMTVSFAPASAATRALPNDFNGDGYADLAIGVSSETIGGATRAGAVHVLNGSSDGVTTADDRLWSQATDGIAGIPEDDDAFGSALASGDFDADGFADLAIGAPTDGTNAAPEHGVVHVLYGTSDGLAATRSQLWSQDQLGNEPEALERFGTAVTVGDFDADGYDDLAIGVPYEDVGEVRDAGVTQVLRGSEAGLTASGAQTWSQGSADIEDEPETVINPEENIVPERFGWTLASGDLNEDGFADLVVGVPGESFPGAYGGGAVNVIYGSGDGLAAAGDQVWSQASEGIAGTPEHQLGVDWDTWHGDGFGSVLAVGDTDADGDADVAVGVPNERIGARCPDEPPCYMGMAHLILGTEDEGLTSEDAEAWTQGSAGIAGAVEEGDRFGAALAIGDVDGDNRGELVIGAPGEGIDGMFNVGVFHVLPGAASGVTASGSELWSQKGDLVGKAEESDYFGSSLLIRNFGRSGRGDLAVGAYWESVGDVEFAGRATVIYGTRSGLSTANARTFDQGTPGVKGTPEAHDLLGTLSR